MKSSTVNRKMEREKLHKEFEKYGKIIRAMWYCSLILIIASFIMFFFVQVTLNRFILIGFIVLGIIMAVYAASWSLIIGSATA